MALSVWQATVQDKRGNALGGASVYVTNANTGSDVTLYSDVDGTTEITNPIVTGSTGLVQFYTTPQVVNIVATTFSETVTWSNVSIYDLDDITIKVDSIADLADFSVADGQAVQTVSYHPGWAARGDGLPKGGNTFVYDGSLVRTNHNGGTIISGGRYYSTEWDAGTWLNSVTDTDAGCFVAINTDEINLYQMGAYGDGSTDDWNSYRKTLYLCSTNEIVMRIPVGDFFIGIGQGGMALNGPLKMSGYGKMSRITREEVLGTSAASILTYTDTDRLEYLHIDGVHFDGAYDTLNYEQTTTYMYCKNIDSVKITNCFFKNISYLVTAFESCKDVQMSGNELDTCARDGLRAISCDKVSVTDNKFRRIYDDAIAIHTNESSLISSNIKTQVVVTGNELEECQGIAILGGQNVTVTGNTLTRCHLRGISVSPGSVEGTNTIYSINISDNTITDMMARVWSVDSWVTLDWQPNLSTTATTRAIEVVSFGGDNTATKTYEINSNGYPQQPYGLTTLADVSANDPVAAADGITIADNVIARTMPYGVAYSTLGYGDLQAKNGDPDDLILASDSWKTVGTLVSGNFGKVRILDNTYKGLWNGVSFKVPNSNDTYCQSCEIRGNEFTDIHRASISNYYSAYSNYCDFGEIVIEDNSFDCDPFYLGVQDYDQTLDPTVKYRRGNGSWFVSSITSADFDVRSGFISYGDITGMVRMNRNTFKNISVIVTDNVSGGALSIPSKLQFTDNTLWVGIDSLDSTFGDSNRGVGQLDKLAALSDHIYYDSDISSGTFGEIQEASPSYTSMPTSGYYMRGKVLTRANPTSGLSYKLIRATTGTGHVAGTDWLSVIAS